MKKRILSILLILVIMLGTFSTVFAADLDLRHIIKGNVIGLDDVLLNDVLFVEVAFNQSSYRIEWKSNLYNLNEVQNRFNINPNLSFDEAIIGLIPWTPPEAEETPSQKQAIIKARDYLSIMPFSKNGLMRQLTYSGFSFNDATYAANKINVDWNNQAVRMSRDYLSTKAFSKVGLIRQLEYSEFTNEEAVYGVNKINVNWKNQALLMAREYLSSRHFTRKALIVQLEYSGFTTEEATYAVDITLPIQKVYVGSIDSDKYHYPNCRWAESILKENEIWFSSKEEAEQKAYTPCGTCKP